MGKANKRNGGEIMEREKLMDNNTGTVLLTKF